MRILIAGSSGLLGSRLALHMALNGHQVRLGSRNPNSEQMPPGQDSVRLKWDDMQSLQQACRGMDVVLHAAGMSAADCGHDPIAALQVNGVASARLAVAARAAGVRCMVYFSTAHVYSSPLTGDITEADCPRNLHPYASSHLAGEFAVMQAASAGGLKSVVLRLSNAFGAPGHPGVACWSLLANDVCRQLAHAGRIQLHSSGRQWRDFIPLSAVCTAVDRLLGALAQLGLAQVFNLGGASMPVLDLVERIRSRYQLQTGLHAALECAAPGAEIICPLDFRTDRLQALTGQLPLDMDSEIDGLLQFCSHNFRPGTDTA